MATSLQIPAVNSPPPRPRPPQPHRAGAAGPASPYTSTTDRSQIHLQQQQPGTPPGTYHRTDDDAHPPPPILATHSGHHRIFIGPILQPEHHNHNQNTPHQKQSNGSSGNIVSFSRIKNASSRPWWERSSNNSSAVSLGQKLARSVTHLPMTATSVHSNNAAVGRFDPTQTVADEASRRAQQYNDQQLQLQQRQQRERQQSGDSLHSSNDGTHSPNHPYRDHPIHGRIPQLSYIFSDDDHSEDDEHALKEGEEEERHHEEAIDHDIETNDKDAKGEYDRQQKRISKSSNGSGGMGPTTDVSHIMPNGSTGGGVGIAQPQSPPNKGKNIAQPNTSGMETDLEVTHGHRRWGSKKDDNEPHRKKATKKMRDEGETGKLRTLFGGRHRKERRNQGKLGASSDDELNEIAAGAAMGGGGGLGSGSGENQRTFRPLERDPTSGALMAVSPRSSLTRTAGGAYQHFVSSPMSSEIDVSQFAETDRKTSVDTMRPDPVPLQLNPGGLSPPVSASDHKGAGPVGAGVEGKGDVSVSDILSNRSNSWMTAREEASFSGVGATLQEHDEEDDGDRFQDAMSPRGAVANGTLTEGGGDNLLLTMPYNGQQEQHGRTLSGSRGFESSTSMNDENLLDESSHDEDDDDAVPMTMDESSEDDAATSQAQVLNERALREAVDESRRRSQCSSNQGGGRTSVNSIERKASGAATVPAVPTTISTAPVLPSENKLPLDPEKSSICNSERDKKIAAEHDGKKHVRFLSKVQELTAPKRKLSKLPPNPILKQDRMICRKEVTDRPGAHVFNAETARKFARQSIGWREYWCVLRGPMTPEEIKKKTEYKFGHRLHHDAHDHVDGDEDEWEADDEQEIVGSKPEPVPSPLKNPGPVSSRKTATPPTMMSRKQSTKKPSSKKDGQPSWWSKAFGAFNHKDKNEYTMPCDKGRLEFYYNHKNMMGTILLSSYTSISVFSSLDYTIAITQAFPRAIGLEIHILRPRTIALACAWYMEIYTILNGHAPLPNVIEINVPDFDVKIHVPMPDDDTTGDEEDEDEDDDNEEADEDEEEENDGGAEDEDVHREQKDKVDDEGHNEHAGAGIGVGAGVDHIIIQDKKVELLQKNNNRFADAMSLGRVSSHAESFRTAVTRQPSKTLYLQTSNARQTIVTPQEVTPKLLRSHVLQLLKDVPDWMDVVRMWLDPQQHGDVALCWKRYDRLEWVYWTDKVLAETASRHLLQSHIGFADGSGWSGGMQDVVVGPQTLDKTHILELRPIVHYPTIAMEPGTGEKIHEPDPVEGFLIRVSTFTGKHLKRFRRLYLTSHDHLLFYTIPADSHSPRLGIHGSEIDPTALLFGISPHHSTDPGHKDVANSSSARRLKGQVRAAKGMIDLTRVKSVRVLLEKEWLALRGVLPREDLYGTVVMQEPAPEPPAVVLTGHSETSSVVGGGKDKDAHLVASPAPLTPSSSMQGSGSLGGGVGSSGGQLKKGIVQDSHDFEPNPFDAVAAATASAGSNAFSSSSNVLPQSDLVMTMEQRNAMMRQNNQVGELPPSSPDQQEPRPQVSDPPNRSTQQSSGLNSLLSRSATHLFRPFQNRSSADINQPSRVFELDIEDGTKVRFRAYNQEAAQAWSDQLTDLAHYWRLRKKQDSKLHMQVSKVNNMFSSAGDDDEGGDPGMMAFGSMGFDAEAGVGRVGDGVAHTSQKVVQNWENYSATAEPEIWNWCVVNGCRSITKSGFLYYRAKTHTPFRKMFCVLTFGRILFFHPYRRSKTSGRKIKTSVSKLFSAHTLQDLYLYSGHFADQDVPWGTNDESEKLPRYFEDGLMADDPDEDCTFSLWRSKRRKVLSRRGLATLSTIDAADKEATMMMANRHHHQHRLRNSPTYGGNQELGTWDRMGRLVASLVKDGVVYGSNPQSCTVLRARSRPELEEWVYAINTEIERFVRAERVSVRAKGA